MEISMVAIKPILMKLGALLVGEFTLEKRVRKGVESLRTELTLMYAALRKVSEVPHEQLDEGVKIWARNVRELSYHMEDIVDAFMVCADDGGEPENPKNKVRKLLKKTIKLFKKGRALHQISNALEEAVGKAKQLAEIRQRYEQDIRYTGAGVTADPTGVSVDPRVMALYTDVTELVGIEETRDELINMLTIGDDFWRHPLKTVSIVGFGGLGKTTLAKTAYDKIKVQFTCCAFVSVSQNPDTRKVLKDILYELDKDKYKYIHNVMREEKHLIDELIEFLTNKRFLIVIDDIWDQKVWQLIKCAFPNKNHGSRLITTTRIVRVAEACCSSSGDIYKMKPLSHDVSRKLFNKRVFSHEKGCPPELVQVSQDIIKKCGGIPLAIITIASLLASNHQIKGKDQWYVLLNSIGRGLTEELGMEEMKKILLFSYYDLPVYLKPCLLYLSIFPEDHFIRRDKLVWKWISEGFVYSDKQETRLYELGNIYFNELVNRSMIQSIDIIDDEEKIKACHVHDMVFDLICSLASEENFANILDNTKRKFPNSQSKVCRLSIQNCKVDVATNTMIQVRSLTFTNNVVDQVLNISNFQVLRVLDLEDCPISDIQYVGSLLHLRYLGLRNTNVKVLPDKIGKLQFLQTLDLANTWIEELPPSTVRLRRLMCLCICPGVKVPAGIGNMTSLEVLQGIRIGGFSSRNLNMHVLDELGLLIKLRVLHFSWGYFDESQKQPLLASLNNLHKLEILEILGVFACINLLHEGWVPSLQLRKLGIRGTTTLFPTLPAWINPSSLPLLSYLSIRLNGVRSEDIQLIGMFPSLRYLELYGGANFSEERAMEMSVVTTDAFPSVIECRFFHITAVPSLFPQGAAQRLKHLRFTFPAIWISRGDIDLSMGHLPSLETVHVQLSRKEGSEEANEAHAALTAAAEDHPNRPQLYITRC